MWEAQGTEGEMSMKRIWSAFGVGAALLAMAPVDAKAQNLTLGQLATAGLGDVCVPVIERGEAIDETARGAGFLEVEGENRASLGGGPGMSWWLYEFPGAVLVVGRDLDQIGSPCRIAVSIGAQQATDAVQEVGDWVRGHSSAFELVRTPKAEDGADRLWAWERPVSGIVQQLQMRLTDHGDGSVSGIFFYGLVSD